MRSTKLQLFGKLVLDDEGARKFVYLYVGVHGDEPIHPDADEITAVEFVPVGALRRMLESRERPFTPTFLSAFALYERGALA